MARSGRPIQYPWDTMEVGESFNIDHIQPSSARSHACTVGKKIGRKFSVHKARAKSVVITRKA